MKQRKTKSNSDQERHCDKQNSNTDPNGSYTGKYLKDDQVILTPPEQDADDL